MEQLLAYRYVNVSMAFRAFASGRAYRAGQGKSYMRLLGIARISLRVIPVQLAVDA
jgi:hypothetical protein